MSIEDGRWSGVVRVGLREKFFNEEKPGTLVNDLLEKHYIGHKMAKVLEDEFKYGDGSGRPAEVVKVSETVIRKPKVDICKQHGIDKNLCRMMKHT